MTYKRRQQVGSSVSKIKLKFSVVLSDRLSWRQTDSRSMEMPWSSSKGNLGCQEGRKEKACLLWLGKSKLQASTQVFRYQIFICTHSYICDKLQFLKCWGRNSWNDIAHVQITVCLRHCWLFLKKQTSLKPVAEVLLSH